MNYSGSQRAPWKNALHLTFTISVTIYFMKCFNKYCFNILCLSLYNVISSFFLQLKILMLVLFCCVPVMINPFWTGFLLKELIKTRGIIKRKTKKKLFVLVKWILNINSSFKSIKSVIFGKRSIPWQTFIEMLISN